MKKEYTIEQLDEIEKQWGMLDYASSGNTITGKLRRFCNANAGTLMLTAVLAGASVGGYAGHNAVTEETAYQNRTTVVRQSIKEPIDYLVKQGVLQVNADELIEKHLANTEDARRQTVKNQLPYLKAANAIGIGIIGALATPLALGLGISANIELDNRRFRRRKQWLENEKLKAAQLEN